MEKPIKMDDLGVTLFLETPICLKLLVENFSTKIPGKRLSSKKMVV